ncbi:unnamed protein product [Sphagnum troendelagicum]|uniref:Uncharacterized protein n=1 Tax=Sphagnum jensenii TaxID=128206 RepID=A0ABP0WIZ0_9BRYO
MPDIKPSLSQLASSVEFSNVNIFGAGIIKFQIQIVNMTANVHLVYGCRSCCSVRLPQCCCCRPLPWRCYKSWLDARFPLVSCLGTGTQHEGTSASGISLLGCILRPELAVQRESDVQGVPLTSNTWNLPLILRSMLLAADFANATSHVILNIAIAGRQSCSYYRLL